MSAISPALLAGVRRYLAAPRAQITSVQRQPFAGGLSGSRFERWRLHLRRAGSATTLMLVRKHGSGVSGAFMQAAAQREALAYAILPASAPLTLPVIVAVDAPVGDIWMLPLPPAKTTSHWRADWDMADVRAVIADLARLHAAFCGKNAIADDWPWLLRPTAADAERLLAEGREGAALIRKEQAYSAEMTPERVERLLALARQPAPLQDALNAGPMTLLHGDAGFQNIAISQDGRQRIWYDWQLVSWGPPALDWVTFLHPWAYPEARPPLSPTQMTDSYLQALAKSGCALKRNAFLQQLDAAFIWRWLIQWAPLLGKHNQRLRNDVKSRLERAFASHHWPALDRIN